MSNDYLAATAAKLTMNAAFTLFHRKDDPSNPYLGHVHTGGCKWTTLAAIGVFNTLRAAGCAEERRAEHWRGPMWFITPLGREMSAYLKAHWDDVSGTFRDPTRKRQEQIIRAGEKALAKLATKS